MSWINYIGLKIGRYQNQVINIRITDSPACQQLTIIICDNANEAQLQKSDIINQFAMNRQRSLRELRELARSKQSLDKEKRARLQNYKSTWIDRVFYRSDEYYVRGKESNAFHRKTYELPIESLPNINNKLLGYTNQVLIQQTDKMTQLFVPAYISLKVKNIQQLNIKDLIAKIHCVLIVTLYVDLLPQELLREIRSKVMVQINRGEGFFLTVQEEKTNIKLKQDGLNKEFLVFTVRASFPVQIYEDIFWSPFEVMRLVLSVTLNSITVHKNSNFHRVNTKQKSVEQLPYELATLNGSMKPQSSFHPPSKPSPPPAPKMVYDPSVTYQISFNCMRNPERITISYIKGCRLGVYDLAQNLLESYPSNLATYDEINSSFIKFVKGDPEVHEKSDDKMLQEQQSRKQFNIEKHHNREDFMVPKAAKNPEDRPPEREKENKNTKIAYYQYSHFVIPIYKCPGNALATIFIPVFMLSLLSLSIFYQVRAFEDKIGSIATFVLGFIALIPSIKDELPPSQKITFAQIIVYIEALNCMLSLISHLRIIFYISMFIHICCFGIAFLLLVLHTFWWERLYKRNYKIHEVDAVKNHMRWSNPWCDNEILTKNEMLPVKMQVLPLKEKTPQLGYRQQQIPEWMQESVPLI